jgi:hypothetical protein
MGEFVVSVRFLEVSYVPVSAPSDDPQADLTCTCVAGIFLVSFFSCMRALLWSDGSFKPFRQVNVKMSIASLVMFIIASLDVAFHLQHNLEAFVWNNGLTPVEEFNMTSNWINVMKMGCYVAQPFVGDSILVRIIVRICFKQEL